MESSNSLSIRTDHLPRPLNTRFWLKFASISLIHSYQSFHEKKAQLCIIQSSQIERSQSKVELISFWEERGFATLFCRLFRFRVKLLCYDALLLYFSEAYSMGWNAKTIEMKCETKNNTS